MFRTLGDGLFLSITWAGMTVIFIFVGTWQAFAAVLLLIPAGAITGIAAGTFLGFRDRLRGHRQ